MKVLSSIQIKDNKLVFTAEISDFSPEDYAQILLTSNERVEDLKQKRASRLSALPLVESLFLKSTEIRDNRDMEMRVRGLQIAYKRFLSEKLLGE